MVFLWIESFTALQNIGAFFATHNVNVSVQRRHSWHQTIDCHVRHFCPFPEVSNFLFKWKTFEQFWLPCQGVKLFDRDVIHLQTPVPYTVEFSFRSSYYVNVFFGTFPWFHIQRHQAALLRQKIRVY